MIEWRGASRDVRRKQMLRERFPSEDLDLDYLDLF